MYKGIFEFFIKRKENKRLKWAYLSFLLKEKRINGQSGQMDGNVHSGAKLIINKIWVPKPI